MRLARCLAALLILGAGAGSAHAQNIPKARLWEIPMGTPITELAADAYFDPACGTNGGPPSLRLASFAEFARCPPDRTTGLHEIWFSEDDELEYIFRARRQGAARVALANAVFSHKAIFSILVDGNGLIQGYRIFTDPEEVADFRIDADTVGDYMLGLYGYEGFACSDVPPGTGETPLDGRFTKRLCVKEADGQRITIEVHYFRKRGQAAINPLTQAPTENEFDSSTRVEVVATAAVQPG